jgi:hypothetical protein
MLIIGSEKALLILGRFTFLIVVAFDGSQLPVRLNVFEVHGIAAAADLNPAGLLELRLFAQSCQHNIPVGYGCHGCLLPDQAVVRLIANIRLRLIAEWP